jgi:hypothetical protein
LTLPLPHPVIQDQQVQQNFEAISQGWPNYGEQWRVVGATGQPAFQNAWVNFGGGLSVVAFYKVGDRVYVKGQVSTGTAGTTIFTLPTGYRPLERLDPPITANGAGSAGTVGTNGDVIPVAAAGNVRVSLDGLSFRTV